MRSHIYNSQFSCRIGIQVGQVFVETYVPSDYWLKVQHWKIRTKKVLGMLLLMEITAVLTHTLSQFLEHVVYQGMLLGLQVAASHEISIKNKKC